jgi:hypothetical protein
MGGFTLINVTTQDAYTLDNTVQGVPLDEFVLIVTGAVIYYQIGYGGNFNTPEKMAPPGFHTRRRPGYDSLRVRSFKPGAPAQVTLDHNPT